MSVPVVKFPLFICVRVLGILVAALVVIWNIRFRGGLALISEDKNLIFNVHPVLMVIGLVLLNGEAMLAYKTVSGTKSYKKLVHLSLQFLAFLFGIIGLWAAWTYLLISYHRFSIRRQLYSIVGARKLSHMPQHRYREITSVRWIPRAERDYWSFGLHFVRLYI